MRLWRVLRQGLKKALVREGYKEKGKMVVAVLAKLKSFTEECRRVLRVTKKPTKTELITVVKVSGIGIALIGLIGFVLNMFNKMIFQ